MDGGEGGGAGEGTWWMIGEVIEDVRIWVADRDGMDVERGWLETTGSARLSSKEACCEEVRLLEVGGVDDVRGEDTHV